MLKENKLLLLSDLLSVINIDNLILWQPSVLSYNYHLSPQILDIV